jgi:hypothetical protein
MTLAQIAILLFGCLAAVAFGAFILALCAMASDEPRTPFDHRTTED